MYKDSRNPYILYPALLVHMAGHRFAYTTFDTTEFKDYPARLEAAMYIDEHDIMSEQYVSYKDYLHLKAKLENLERKHAKLKRRHDVVGKKYYQKVTDGQVCHFYFGKNVVIILTKRKRT